MSLLATKLIVPPSRPGLVPRPRLMERMDEGLRRKFTLISAPAGFGKTTLASEWANDLRSRSEEEQGRATRIAWLSLDRSDNDGVRFLGYVIAALQAAQGEGETRPVIGRDSQRFLHSSQSPPFEAVLTSLLNEISHESGRVVLVLDDYHLIDARPVHEALAFLLDHLAEALHIVVATRDDPPLPLARLRTGGHMAELRAADLRFSSAETSAFLKESMSLDLPPESITTLESRTEGWIAGLQLAAISIRGRPDPSAAVQAFAGSHRFVLDYLIEEVLEKQPDDVQEFLLRTSVLERLSGSLCDALTGRQDGQATLEFLEHANLFVVPMGERRGWYRYHPLFADLLRHRLQQTQAQRLSRLHSRASGWFEKNGFAEEAIEHALEAGDFDRAGPLIEEHVDTMWERGEHLRLREWLSRLPVEVVHSRPHLCVIRAWDLFTCGRLDAAEQSLGAAEQALKPEAAPGDAEPASDRRDRGRIAVIRAYLSSYRGDLPGTIRFARRALKHLTPEDANWRGAAGIALGDAHSLQGQMTQAYRARKEALQASRGDGNLHLIAGLKLAETRRQQARPRRCVEICEELEQSARETGLSRSVAAGWLLSILGEALAELDRLDAALGQAMEGVRLTEGGRDVRVMGASNLCLLRVQFSRADIAGAERTYRTLERMAQKHDVPPFLTSQASAWRVRLLLAEGARAAAQWIDELDLDTDGRLTREREPEYLALTRVLLSQGRFEEANLLLRRLLEQAETRDHPVRLIEILTLQSLGFLAAGDAGRGVAALERALAQAEPGGCIRVFVDEGPQMAGLLYEALTRGIAPDYLRLLLNAFPVGDPLQAGPLQGSTATPESPNLSLVEPLSERELEVLRLIAQGLQNQQIGSRLFVSLNTVKVHTRNIYGKLGIHSRTQAVAKARALGILPLPE